MKVGDKIRIKDYSYILVMDGMRLYRTYARHLLNEFEVIRVITEYKLKSKSGKVVHDIIIKHIGTGTIWLHTMDFCEVIEGVKEVTMKDVENMEKRNDFSKARVGKKLYSMRFGWVQVARVSGTGVWCIYGDNSYENNWDFRGFTHPYNKTQDLYWREPKIEFIPDPKIKSRIEDIKYVNYYPDKSYQVHDTEDKAIRCGSGTLHQTVEATLTFEIEE